MKDEKGLSPIHFIPIPFPVLEKLGELIIITVGVSVLTQYISYRASIEMANSKNSEGWRHQKEEDRKARDDFNQRQAKMQESIDNHFPEQNDPNRKPNWNGKHKGLRIFLSVLELMHQEKGFIAPEEKEQDHNKENQERTPKEKGEYNFQPKDSSINAKEPSSIGIDWIQSLNNHMSNRLP